MIGLIITNTYKLIKGLKEARDKKKKEEEEKDKKVEPIKIELAGIDDRKVRLTPNSSDLSGAVLINYTIADGHGGTATASVTVNVGTNTPPQGADATVSVVEDGSRVFAPSDFGFTDADAGQSLAAVRIETLPAAGTLTLGGVAVVAGQVINAADFGQLAYTPAPNASGNGYAGLTFSVQDSAGAFDATPNSVTVNVTPVPDAAVGSSRSTAAACPGRRWPPSTSAECRPLSRVPGCTSAASPMATEPGFGRSKARPGT